MKKLIAFCFLIALLPACKKKRNCVCNTTIIYSQGQESFSSKNSPMTEKMSEKQAKAVCDHEAENINQMYINYSTNNGNWSTNGTTYHTNCSLQ